MTDAPTIVRADDPDDVAWDDETRGRVVFHTRIDAAAAPTSGLVLGTACIEEGDAEAPHHHNLPEEGLHPLRQRPGDRRRPRDASRAGRRHVRSRRGSSNPGSEGEALQALCAFPTDRFDEVEYHWATAG